MKNVLWYVLGAVVVALLAGAWWFMGRAPAPVPYDIPLVAPDTVVSWSFQGAYTGKPDLVAKAETEIGRLTRLLGETDSDYEIYVSIANQYDLVGDGENELRYLGYALSIDDDITGLAWYNAGVLYERLGALTTARAAYQKAALAEPIPQYVNAYEDFVKAHPVSQ